MKIVFLDKDHIQRPEEPFDYSSLSQLGEFEIYRTTADSQVVERATNAEVLITVKNGLSRSQIEGLESVRLICKAGTGFNNIDIEAAQAMGIAVCNLPGYGSYIVAQWTWTLLLALAGNIFAYDRELRAGVNWSSLVFLHPVTELRGKTLGLIGFGKISQQVALWAKAFGLRVLIYSQFPQSSRQWLKDFEFVSLEVISRESDFISVHSHLNDQTKDLVNEEFLSRVKPSCYLINTARAAIINENALIQSLKEKRIAGAALDVFWKEPVPQGHPLLSLQNVLLTPHMAWGSTETRQKMLSLIAEVISRFYSGDPINLVNSVRLTLKNEC